ncbi:MAG TPA: response regulator [Candidatus Acidoferrum sp.]|nr:response regulator [Candidatus Acidoferrum sp.]
MTRELKWILLAEDDPNDAHLTKRALVDSKAPPEIVVARDGAEALDVLYHRGAFAKSESTRPCVVLLDLKMPKVNGLEVLRAIKGDPKLRTIPVVMLTSSRQERDLMESYDLGANAYVVKPVSFADFREALREVGSFWVVINELPPQTMVM